MSVLSCYQNVIQPGSQSGDPNLPAPNDASHQCHHVQGSPAGAQTGLNVEVTYSYKVERPAAGKNPRQIICCLELTGNAPTGEQQRFSLST